MCLVPAKIQTAAVDFKCFLQRKFPLQESDARTGAKNPPKQPLIFPRPRRRATSTKTNTQLLFTTHFCARRQQCTPVVPSAILPSINGRANGGTTAVSETELVPSVWSLSWAPEPLRGVGRFCRQNKSAQNRALQVAVWHVPRQSSSTPSAALPAIWRLPKTGSFPSTFRSREDSAKARLSCAQRSRESSAEMRLRHYEAEASPCQKILLIMQRSVFIFVHHRINSNSFFLVSASYLQNEQVRKLDDFDIQFSSHFTTTGASQMQSPD